MWQDATKGGNIRVRKTLPEGGKKDGGTMESIVRGWLKSQTFRGIPVVSSSDNQGREVWLNEEGFYHTGNGNDDGLDTNPVAVAYWKEVLAKHGIEDGKVPVALAVSVLQYAEWEARNHGASGMAKGLWAELDTPFTPSDYQEVSGVSVEVNGTNLTVKAEMNDRQRTRFEFSTEFMGARLHEDTPGMYKIEFAYIHGETSLTFGFSAVK